MGLRHDHRAGSRKQKLDIPSFFTAATSDVKICSVKARSLLSPSNESQARSCCRIPKETRQRFNTDDQIRDPARFDWHEVLKVEYYTLSVQTLRKSS